MERSVSRWGRDFDPERLARLELALWKAYDRGRPARLFRLLVRANQAQAGVDWLRGQAAEVRDRGAAFDPAGPGGDGQAYWPEVARLLRLSYRRLSEALRSGPDTTSIGA